MPLHPTLFGMLASLALAAPDEPVPHFSVVTGAQSRSRCALLGLQDNKLTVEQANTRMELDGLVELSQENQTLPPPPVRDFILFSNGDRLPLDPTASASL